VALEGAVANVFAFHPESAASTTPDGRASPSARLWAEARARGHRSGSALHAVPGAGPTDAAGTTRGQAQPSSAVEAPATAWSSSSANISAASLSAAKIDSADRNVRLAGTSKPRRSAITSAGNAEHGHPEHGVVPETSDRYRNARLCRCPDYPAGHPSRVPRALAVVAVREHVAAASGPGRFRTPRLEQVHCAGIEHDTAPRVFRLAPVRACHVQRPAPVAGIDTRQFGPPHAEQARSGARPRSAPGGRRHRCRFPGRRRP
jgi:hypothetical protein